LHPQDHGTKSAEASIQKSLMNLETASIDLFLLHYPVCWGDLCHEQPEGDWKQSWRVMEQYYQRGTSLFRLDLKLLVSLFVCCVVLNVVFFVVVVVVVVLLLLLSHLEGILKSLGVSNFREDELRELWSFAVVKPFLVQNHFQFGNMPKSIIGR
jgi:diketogulonate reductase-like aldo/keto reductase